MSSYNHKCPACGATIIIGHISVYCGTEIGKDGWTIKLTDKETAEKSGFSCPRCQTTVPADWVFKEMTEKDAKRIMERWGANPYSIHNQKPFETKGDPPSKKDSAPTTEPSSPSSTPTDSKIRKGAGTRKPTSSGAKTATPSSSPPRPESITPKTETTSDDSIFA